MIASEKPKSNFRQITNEDGKRRYEVTEPDGTVLVLPSVTTILGVIGKPALIAWSAKVEREAVVHAATELHKDLAAGGTRHTMSPMAYQSSLLKRLGADKAHTRQLQKASSIGSAVHALIEWNLHRELGHKVGHPPDLPPEGLPCFAAYERWRNDVEMRPLLIEQTVWSAGGKYAGTMDLFCEMTVKGERCQVVVDWKTSSGVWKEYHLQIAAYATALCEMGHCASPPHGMIVRLPKTAKDAPEPEAVLVEREKHAGLMDVFASVRALWAWQEGG